jgi:hypothetical protein
MTHPFDAKSQISVPSISGAKAGLCLYKMIFSQNLVKTRLMPKKILSYHAWGGLGLACPLAFSAGMGREAKEARALCGVRSGSCEAN